MKNRQGFRKLPGMSGAGEGNLCLYGFSIVKIIPCKQTTLKLSELKLQSFVFTYTSWIKAVLCWVILFQPEAPAWLVPLLLGYTSDLSVCPHPRNPAEGIAASQDDGRGIRRQAQLWKFTFLLALTFNHSICCCC